MPINVFVVGRSGSGKSTAVGYMKELAIKRHYSTIHIKDYTILLDMSKEPAYKTMFRPNEREGFDVLDFSVLDIALERLFEKLISLENSQKYDIIFIEFARQRYKNAFEKLGTRLRNKYYILFVEASLNTCIARIDKRATERLGEDQHYISDKIMKGYFSADNWSYMNSKFTEQLNLPPEHLMKIYNEGEEKQLELELQQHAHTIFCAVTSRQRIAVRAKKRKKLFSSHTVRTLKIMSKAFSHNTNAVKPKRKLATRS